MSVKTQIDGWVSAEIFIREQPLKVTLADGCVWHAENESKRPVRCIAQMLGAYQTPRDRINPILRLRQTMQAIV
jgi:hypothetical protein